MDQTTWVIQVLDDSNCRSIEYLNRYWLRQNVEKLHIFACVEDCTVTTFDIVERWGEGSFVIQEGKEVCFKADFNPGKEALLIVKRQNGGHLVFLYLPKE